MSDHTGDLKPCPFCGGEASVEEDAILEGWEEVRCQDCEAVVGSEDGSAKRATAAWNRRSGIRKIARLEAALKEYVPILEAIDQTPEVRHVGSILRAALEDE